MIRTDLRWALRHLLRRPAFLVLGTAALGLGLAAVVLVFMAVNTLVLRPAPGISDAQPLVELGRLSRDGTFDTFSHPDFVDLRDNVRSLDKVYAYRMTPAYATVRGAPGRVLAFLVSGDYFEALGVGAAQGALLSQRHDAAAGQSPVVVASHAAFQRLFGGDPSAIGSTLEINGTRLTLIGVADPAFHGHVAALAPDFYVPLAMAGALKIGSDTVREQRASTSLMLGGRIAAGATLPQVQAELDALDSRLAAQYPESNRETVFAAAPLRPLPQAAQGMVWMLAIALFVLCGAILALACTNLAGVLVAQGESRSGEFAMRSVLGASRMRLARQLFLEALLVALAGGAFALALVFAGRGVLNLLPLPSPFPVDLALRVDWRVVAFCFGAAAVVSLGVGLLPALRVSARAPGREMVGTGGSVRSERQRLRHGLLALQAALTVALLLTAALVLRGLDNATGIDTGFRSEGVYTAEIDLTPLAMEQAEATALLEQLAGRLQAQPGVQRASFASVVPLTLSRFGFGAARIPGSDELFDLDMNTVGHGFFDVFGLPVRGRPFTTVDAAGTPRTAVINRTFARRLFGDADPLGSEFEIGWGERWVRVQVVGVVPDGRYASVSDSGTSFAFVPAAQWPRLDFSMVVHADVLDADIGAEALRRMLEREMATLLPGVPPPPVHAFADAASLSILPQKILASAASALGALALLLAATGLYGMLAFQVAHRVREFGVCKALGAPAAKIVRALLQRSATWLAIGAVVGLALGQVAALALGDLLFGIGGTDPWALAGVLSVFMAMVAIASALPLRRALRLQPMDALRCD